MLQEETVRVLRESGIAEQVVTPDVSARPAYELTGNIKQLDHILGETSASVVVSVEFSFNRLDDDELLLLDTIVSKSPVEDVTVQSATRAMADALNDVLLELLARLERL